MIIEGAISVKAAIENNKREVTQIYIDKSNRDKNFNYIRKIAKNNKILINEINKNEFDSIEHGKTFGGVLADASLRIEDQFDNQDIFYVCGIEDPFNLGYIIRNLYAFGINNIILDKKDYEKLDAQILKSSAGAYDMINIKYTNDAVTLIKHYKNNNYRVYGLSRKENSKDIFNIRFHNPSILIVGGEKRGISSSILELCDELLFIPYGNNFRNSLNAANALGCVATLLYQQRK